MSISRKLAIKRTVMGLAAAGLVSALLVAGCGGTSSTPTDQGPGTYQGTGTPLTPQTGTQSYLFYGNSDRTKLASIRNVRVIDPKNASTVLIQREGDAGGVAGTFPVASGAMPKPSTTLTYTAATQKYTDLSVNSLKYVVDGNPYTVSMIKEAGVTKPAEKPHSNATGLTNPVYKEIEYLGTQVFLTAKDSTGKGVLICPKALETSAPMPFDNKDLLTIAYNSYGAAATGVIALNKTTGVLEHWTPGSTACPACGILGVDAVMTPINYGTLVTTPTTVYKFLGDIGGTAKSMLLIDDKLYILDKNTAALTLTAVAPGTTFPAVNFKAFMDDSAYFIAVDSTTNIGTLTRVQSTGAVTQVASDINVGKIHSFTNDWVIYGYNDMNIYAARKDGTTATPVLLSQTTQNSGHRASQSNMAWGNKVLYTKYKVTATGTTYQACMFDGDGSMTVHDMPTMTDITVPYNISCKDNGFWAALTAAKNGTFNFKTTFPYTPYALLRMEVSDSNGGGTLLAVDPATPLADGVTMGPVHDYSFDTFMQNYSYRLRMIDSDGYIIVYGKNDDVVKGDAFMVNLNQANSLVNLTNEGPAGAEISASTNALHCHGRTCSTCHNFAAGKIFNSKAGVIGTNENFALGHNIRFKFQNGTSTMARKGKGQGENFNLPLKNIVDNFMVEVVRESDGVVVNQSTPYLHGGKNFANCDYCHSAVPLNGAPGSISIAP